MTRRRAILSAAVLVAVLALLAVLPAVPPIRGYLVERVVGALESGGTSVSYSGTSGNAWRGVALEDARIEGAGIDLEVDRVRVGYFLPSLLGGELPLDVSVRGARGSVDLSEILTDLAAGPAGPAGPISVQLRRLTLEDVEVEVEEAPFTLPNATVSELEVTQDGTILDLAGTVTTSDGEARVSGRFETLTGTFDGRVERADATIARHWWNGITAGELSGDLSLRGGVIAGEFTVTDAAVRDIGLVATDVDADVTLDYPVITADLTGQTLGGRVAATGVVNVAAERWEAEASGSVALEQAAGWLLRDSYPDGPPVDVEGQADVAVNLRGWDYVALDGSASGSGAVAGVSVQDIETTFRLPQDGRVRAGGTATVGGGPLTFDMGPGQAGERLQLTATGVSLDALQDGLGTADVQLRIATDGREDGDLDVAWEGELAGRLATARLDAQLGPDGWQGFLTGNDVTGAEIEGAAVLAEDRLEGGLTLSGLNLPELPASTRVNIGVSGPATLDGTRVTLALGADGPVTPAMLESGPDLSGSLAGTYRDGAITGIVGRFGPVAVSGSLDLDPLALTADLLVEPTNVELAGGGVAADVTVPASSLVYGPDGLAWNGQVAYSNVAAGPATTPDGALSAGLRASPGTPEDPWRLIAESEDGAVSLVMDPAGVSAQLAGFRVELAGSAPGEPMLAGALTGEVVGTSADVTVEDAGGGSVALPADVRLIGNVAPQDERLELAGWLGALPVLLRADWSGPLTASAELDPLAAETLAVAYDAESSQVSLSGSLDVGRAVRLVTLSAAPLDDPSVTPTEATGTPPIDAVLRLDLSGVLAGGAVTDLAGGGSLVVTDPVELRAELVGQGDIVGVTVAGEAAGFPVAGQGELDLTNLADLGAGQPLLSVDVGPIEDLVVGVEGLTGEGVLDGVLAGPVVVPDVPWALDVRWGGGPSGTLSIAGSSVEMQLADGELLVDGPISVPVTYAGEALVASVSVAGGRADLGDLANTELTATIARGGQPSDGPSGGAEAGAPLLTATGTAADLAITGELPASLLAAPLPESARPTGSLTLSGSADLISGTVDLAIGEDLDLTFAGGEFRLRADDADVAPYLPGDAPYGLRVSVDGLLLLDPATGWDGGLTAEVVLPGTEPVTAELLVIGQGAALNVELTAAGPLESTLRASGTITPELRVSGVGNALAGAVTADIEATPETGLAATVRSTALTGAPYFAVPPLEAQVSWDPATAGPTVTGTWISAGVQRDGELAGDVDLAFTLLGEPAALSATLGGTLGDPRATATVTGTGVRVEAEGSPSAADATLRLTEPAISAALPTAAAGVNQFITSPLLVRAAWSAQDGWDMTADATGDVPGLGPLGLDLALNGDGAAYQGQLDIGLTESPGDGHLASAQVSGVGDDLEATLDLSTVDYETLGAALGVDVDLVATGLVALGTSPATADVSVDLSGTIEGADVSLTGTAPDDLDFTLRSGQADLSGRLAWNEERRVVVRGEVAGRVVDAWLTVDDAFETGTLHVDVPGARLDANLTSPEPGVRVATVTGTLSGDGVWGLTGDLSGELVARGSDVDVSSLQVSLDTLPALADSLPLVVTGSGSLSPTVDLAGTVAAEASGTSAMSEGDQGPPQEAGEWRLTGDPLEASIDWLGLEATYAFEPGEVTLTAQGDVTPALNAFAPDIEGLNVSLEGPGLTWNASAGFAGRLDATLAGDLVPAEAQPLAVTLTGQAGALAVGLAAGTRPDGSPLAALEATVPYDALADGRFTAAVDVSGELSAAGRLDVDGDGAALRLAGDGLMAEATLSGGGWSVAARLEDYTVGELLPQVEDPTVSLALTGGSATGGVAIEDIVVASGASRVEGSASFDGSLRAALHAQLDLADLDVGGTELTGLIRGPLVLVAPSLGQLTDATLTAQLDAAGLGVEGVPARVDGALQVGGTLTDPIVFALLNGRENLRGSLRLEAAPARGRLDLRSTLAYGDVETDLRASVSEETVIASGSLRAGDAVLLLEDAEGGVVLTGAGRLDGWSAVVSRGLTGLSASGPLAAVSPSLAGQVEVDVGSMTEGGPWLAGTVSGLELSGQTIGDVDVTSSAPGAPVLVTGPGIEGRFEPSDQTWAATVEGFALPSDLVLALEATGRGATATATGSLSGGNELGVSLDLDVALEEGGASLAVAGTALGGDLRLEGAKPNGGMWTGEVSLRGAGLPADDQSDPGVVLSANGVLQGGQLVPQLVVGTAAFAEEAGVAAAGRLTAGPAGITVDQTVALPLAGAPVRVQGRLAPQLDVSVFAEGDAAGLPSGSVRLAQSPGGLLAMGALTVPLGPVTLELSANGDPLLPRLTAALPDAELAVDLAASDVGALITRVTQDGLVVSGEGAAHGTAFLALSPAPRLELRGLGATAAGFTVELSGTLALDDADLSGTLTLPLPTKDPQANVLPIAITGSGETWQLASDGPLGTVDAEYDTATGAALVDIALELPPTDAPELAAFTSGAVSARVAYDPVFGPSGTLTVADVVLEPPAWGTLAIGAEAAFADGRVGGAATIQTEAGSISLNGDAPLGLLLPGVELANGGSTTTDSDLELRIRALEVSELPAVNQLAPHLSGAVSGVLQVRNGFAFGQLLAPELAVGETALPMTVQVAGPLSRVDVALVARGSLISVTLADMTLSGLARLERFPLDLVAEAVVGPSDVSAFLTGVARLDVPLLEPATGYVAVASEELSLERAGIVTRGDLTLVYDQGALRVDRATFTGRGVWEASGVLSPDELDFALVADEADFGPLLGLVPALAQYGVGAEGSFTFAASGTLDQPEITFETDRLDFQVAGMDFRLREADVGIVGANLTATATLSALEPLSGDLEITSEATVSLDPVALRAVDVAFAGDLNVPGIGTIDEVRGSITQDPELRPFLALSGELGSPFNVQGTLEPLDLRAGGTGLNVSYPGLLIARSTLAADLRLVSEEGGVALSGSIQADEVVLDPDAGAAQAAGADGPAPGDAATDSATDTGDAEAQPPEEAGAASPADAVVAQSAEDPGASTVDAAGVPASPVRAPQPLDPAQRNALSALRFADLRITAPQRVVLTTSFASLEAALDLTLSGTAADPRLTGEARTLRGNLRFAGREFTVDEAAATFAANRGVLPDLLVSAHTEFEKNRVLAASPNVSFAAPDGRTFRVDLAFRGPVERTDEGRIRFDVDPTLTSDALVEVAPDPEDPANAVGGGVRPLTEAELLSLVTLGRIELGADLIGASGLGGAVAQGALDTAVDVLLLGEFQNALREALGLDVFEIRTSAFSSLLEGGGEPFGVSVRLGGYLNPELFASYTLGTADPDDPGFAITNEVALQYALGPLDLELSGRLDFPMAGVLASPRSEIGVGLSYDVGRTIGLDLSTSLSTDRSAVSFGVTFRW